MPPSPIVVVGPVVAAASQFAEALPAIATALPHTFTAVDTDPTTPLVDPPPPVDVPPEVLLPVHFASAFPPTPTAFPQMVTGVETAPTTCLSPTTVPVAAPDPPVLPVPLEVPPEVLLPPQLASASPATATAFPQMVTGADTDATTSAPPTVTWFVEPALPPLPTDVVAEVVPEVPTEAPTDELPVEVLPAAQLPLAVPPTATALPQIVAGACTAAVPTWVWPISPSAPDACPGAASTAPVVSKASWIARRTATCMLTPLSLGPADEQLGNGCFRNFGARRRLCESITKR